MFDVLIPYIHTKDCGLELKYALRSLKNVTNWSDQVWIVGDRELWFSDKINYVAAERLQGQPYYDQVSKMLSVLDKLPEQFIASQDDVYITESTEIGVYQQGELVGSDQNHHKKTKKFTAEVLKELGFDKPLDYECHAPMLVEREKMRQVLSSIRDNSSRDMLQWRSVYGNMYTVVGTPFEDKKTHSSHLTQGPIISTKFYIDELAKLFPKPSKFEIVI